ncbi:DNA polymerase III subunit gamma/tau [Urbifossiella limnaea]|uniref:DNA polymerase III subunit gamma/tau n=1 Tax=Urbifossiella limnaea TaxID=2528023 RepID=A0A517XSV5_9BACT|nr:DNA polymerase III subunit gamma/tau [Urbifossiella limnaea]QDU20616.1 DNA polymerase III subunit tau [Urbifossiella limnaea]
MANKPPPPDPAAAEYTVVARRYRPQQFAELIGQEHVAQALVNALQSGRVAHAYLFTGARGVGKTSAARILAKALNCETGTTPTPCDKCDSCLAVAAGEDVDVLEIDGASNNKVEEVRDLRQNVGFRPTRGRYKIYIIDEVHMLSTSAFNALLKTLEEPPPHVKFIFATTEVQKIPVTILSRCQRFDFAYVGPGRIFDQLKAIVSREGHQADDDALKLVARRAAGSMRDSQSLLDQLLASATGTLTADHVNAVLGTSGDDRVIGLAAAILDRDAAKALNLLSEWIDRGLQVGELLDQLIEYWRALMLVSCAPELKELPHSPLVLESVSKVVGRISLDTVLAGLDVWTTTKARVRGMGHGQVLLEMAAVRLARMDEALSVGQLLRSIAQGGPPHAAPGGNGVATMGGASVDGVKKNSPLTLASDRTGWDNSAVGDGTPRDLTVESVAAVWQDAKRILHERAPLLASQLDSALVPAIFGPNSLAIRFPPGYNSAYQASATEQGLLRVQDALKRVTGKPVTVRFDAPPSGGPAESPAKLPATSAAERKKTLMTLPFFQKAADSLGAQLWHVDEAFDPAAVAPQPATPTDDTDEAT